MQKCTFEPTPDEEIYGLPPGWTRRHGPGYPRYVRVRVDEEHPLAGRGRCLRVELNGGAAAAFGPAIAVEPGVDYVLEGYVTTSALRHDKAWLTLAFLDAARVRLDEANSEKIGGTTPWQRFRVGPVTPPPGASLLSVVVNVAPQGEEQDLTGTASFGSLWVGRVPRIVLTARAVETGGPQPAADAALEPPQPATAYPLRGRPGPGDVSFYVFPRDPRPASGRPGASPTSTRQAGTRPIEFDCLVTGFAAPQYEVRIELQDDHGRAIAGHQESFSSVQASSPGPIAKSSSARAKNAAEPRAGSFARATWTVPANLAGYYRACAEVAPLSHRESAAAKGSLSKSQPQISHADPHKPSPPAPLPGHHVLMVGERSSIRAALGLAIVDRRQPPSGSEFGWCLEPGDASLGLVPLGDLLTQSGIRWVKYPFVSQARPDRIEPLINFNDRLATAGVRLAGVLHPPLARDGDSQRGTTLLAAEVFGRDPKVWYPSIEPVLARLATEVRFWQIGDDRDAGWAGCGDLPAAVSRVKAALDRIGQDLDVGIAWDLRAPLPMGAPEIGAEPGVAFRSAKERSSRGAGAPAAPACGSRVGDKAPWRFLSLYCDSAATDAELAKRLDATASAGVSRWLAIEALPRSGRTSDDRIAHLVGRLLTAKAHGAEGIFFARPFDPERGLVGRDGSPNELFLPWRTTALMLGGAAYAGDIDLGGGSHIHCFGSHGTYVGVVPAGAPQREAVYLGDRLQSCDLWGRIASLPASPGTRMRVAGPRSFVDIQPLPTFLTGLDGTIAEWQLNARFTPKSLPSVPAAAIAMALEMKNTLPRAVTGRVRIAPPRDWSFEPRSAEFRLEPGAAWKLPLKIILPDDVLAGPQLVALEFELRADRPYRFTMYRPIEVSGGAVAIGGRAALDDRGDLEVRQTLSNEGKRAIGFRCCLLAPDRRRQAAEVTLQPRAKSEFVYRLPDGHELLGKPLWLRAEEIDGPRVLNCRVEAGP